MSTGGKEIASAGPYQPVTILHSNSVSTADAICISHVKTETAIHDSIPNSVKYLVPAEHTAEVTLALT